MTSDAEKIVGEMEKVSGGYLTGVIWGYVKRWLEKNNGL